MSTPKEAKAALGEISRLARENAPALDKALRTLSGGALTGSAAVALHEGLVSRRSRVRKAFTNAYEQVRRVAAQAEGGGSVGPLDLGNAAPPAAPSNGSFMGGDPATLQVVLNQMDEAAQAWHQVAGPRLSRVLSKLGMDSSPGGDVAAAGRWVESRRPDLKKRREQLLKKIAPPQGPSILTLAPAEGKQTIQRLANEGVLPSEFSSMTVEQAMRAIEQDPRLAQRLQQLEPSPFSTSPGERALALALIDPTIARPQDNAAKVRRDAVRGVFDRMSPRERQWIALLYPNVVGNLPGAPFSERMLANRVKIVAELARERVRLSEREAKDRENEGNDIGPGPLDRLFPGGTSRDNNDMDGKIKDSRNRIKLFENLLKDDPNKPGFDRQILLFDPKGDMRIAELHGTIGPNTRNVGVLVPGTNMAFNKFEGFDSRALSFVDHAERSTDQAGSLAMITWMGGDFPEMADAARRNAADAIGPPLADFSHQLRQEINFSGATGTKITVAGHSYGGAIVGTSEKFGLDANRVMHIESAGTGAGVDGPQDYRNPNDDVRRFTMTAPFDFIAGSQGKNLPGVGHGMDPDGFPGMTRLRTGDYPDDYRGVGRLLLGPHVWSPFAHTSVFVPRSDSWWNMYNVFTGGTIVRRGEDDQPVECVNVP